jgi:hypothetical protein
MPAHIALGACLTQAQNNKTIKKPIFNYSLIFNYLFLIHKKIKNNKTPAPRMARSGG